MSLKVSCQTAQLSPVLLFGHMGHHFFAPGNLLRIAVNNGHGGISGNDSEDFWIQHGNAGKCQKFSRSTSETENTSVVGHLDPVELRLILQHQSGHGTGTLVLEANLPEINGS